MSGFPLRSATVVGALLMTTSLLLALALLPSGSHAGERVSGERTATLMKESKRAKKMGRQLRGCVNKKRMKHGLNPLSPAKPLQKAANFHADSMRKENFFDHIDRKGRDAADRVGIFGSKSRYKPIGENLGAGFDGGRGVCRAWMDSSSHRANMLSSSYNVVGAGYSRGGDYGSYHVLVFGRQ